MVNPFCTDQKQLLSLASGVLVDAEVADSLLGAEELGEKQFLEFKSNNLMSDKPDLFQTIKRNKLQTFSSSKSSRVMSSKGKESGVVMSRNLFARLLLIAKSREVDLKDVLSYSLGVYPLSLSTTSGSLLKTAKCKLFEIVEDEAGSPLVDLKQCTNNALIVDAMAVLQGIKGKWKTFGEFADCTFNFLMKQASEWNVTRLDFVADRYPPVSIKNTERLRRASQGVQKVHIFGEEQNVAKQWKKFMSCGDNKESLMDFLTEHWKSYRSSRYTCVMYVTTKNKCYLYTPGDELQ